MAKNQETNQPPKAPASPSEQESTRPVTAGQQRRRQQSVFQYISILFAAAFVLLLFTFMMERRQYEQDQTANQEQINELQQDSKSALQTLNNIIAERDKLKEENEALTDRLETETKKSKEAAAAATDQARAIQAMDWFWRIQRQYSRGYIHAARELAKAFEETSLPAFLPDVTAVEPDGPSPKQQYQELRDLLLPAS